MSRFLLHAAVLLLPFLLYGVYLWRVKRSGRDGPAVTPWFWLVLSGLILMGVSFGVVSLMGEHGGGTYVPARMQDGRIVPGEVRR